MFYLCIKCFILVSRDPLISIIESRISNFWLFDKNVYNLIDIQEWFKMSLWM